MIGSVPFRLPLLPDYQLACAHQWSEKMRSVPEYGFDGKAKVTEAYCLKCDLGCRNRWRLK
jgi:hypothetical protein